MKSGFLPVRSPRYSLWLVGLAAAGLLTLGSARLSAQTAYTWNGGTGNWSNGSLWSTSSVPNSASADVSLDGGKTGTASVVGLDNNYTVGRLTIDVGDTLNVVTNTEWTVSNGAFAGSGSIVNNGTINFNDAGNGTFLHFAGAGSITGTGTINLNGPASRIFTNNAGDGVTIGAGQTVAGRGNLGAARTTLTNNGTVTANQNGGTLVLEPGGVNGFANVGNGAARAENGGVLELASGTFSGGAFTALAGSRVQVDSGAVVNNATLASVGTGTVTMFSATLNNATLAGSVSINNDAEAVANGTLINNGTLTINDTGSGTFLRLGSTTTLAGNGTVNLTGPAARLFANNAGNRLMIGQGQTIRGQGNLGNGSTTFTNNGTVAANVNAGTLTIQPGGGAADFTNNGYLYASDGGTLQFNNANGGTLTNNGTLYVSGGSTISVPAGALTNLVGTTLTGGTYGVSAVGAATNTLSFGGGSIVTNNAVVSLSGAGATFSEINSLANNQGSFEVTTHNFTTAGALTNSGSTNAFFNSPLTVAGNLTNSGLTGSYANSTIAVQGNLVNSGQLATGSAASPGTTFRPGTVTVAGILTQTATGTIFGGGNVTATSFSLGGTLRPGDRDEENIIAAAVGTLTFNGQIGLLGSATLVFDLANTATSDRISVNGTLTLDGKLNVNALEGFGVGRYDLIDYTGALTDNALDLGTLPGGYHYAIDTSIVGQVDLVVTSDVPEPATWTPLMMGAGLLAVVLRRRVASRA